ncbi:hypothetical protein [Chondromyces apiculatus]|uniref:STAS domain-containing protein n=1 Tax=Chondromyces apiculatus DSM 436 TaxID=1192034 RepID=A0A017TFW8_9BACT|nr:hypothetical protein [Chondromyces apiculatus]EYF08183.1 Hypothetical protein CAP_5943 [Chondromyces apiculatus DSM 436]
MDQDGKTEFRVGAHLVTLEAHDLLKFSLHGPLSPQEARQMFDLEREVVTRVGYVFILADVSKLGELSSATRKTMRSLEGLSLRCVAIYGASFQARLLISMALLAQKLLRLEGGDHPVYFCATETEARLRIATKRAEHLPGGVRHKART